MYIFDNIPLDYSYIEMFQTKVVEKMKTNILCSVTLFGRSLFLWDNVDRYGRAGKSTGDNILWHKKMLCACRIT